MTRRGYSIDLDDEDANYTIGQLLTHLQHVFDRSEYDKVGKLLRRREERIGAEMFAEIERLKEVAANETKAEVNRVKVEILAEMELMRNGLEAVNIMYERLVMWKVTMEKSFEKIDKEKEILAQENQRLKREVRVLREMNEELTVREEAEKVRVLELETKVEVEESLRMRAEEDQEYAENMFKELKLRISMLEKQNDMLMTGGGSDLVRHNLCLRRIVLWTLLAVQDRLMLVYWVGIWLTLQKRLMVLAQVIQKTEAW